MKRAGSVLLAGLLVGAVTALAVTVQTELAPAPVAASRTVLAAPVDVAAEEPPAASEPEPTPLPVPGRPPGPGAPADDENRPEIELDRLAPGADLGVVVFDRVQDRTVYEHGEGESFTSASLVKVLIGLDALSRGNTTSSLVERMISRSDDQLASTLWVANGGTRIVNRWAEKLGLTDTRPPRDPGRWGDTVVTATDIRRVYEHLLADPADPPRAAILAGLRGATERGSDGFDQSFGIPDAATSMPHAVKQGWACCRQGRQLHTSGIVGDNNRYIVVVLSNHPSSVSDAVGSKRITSVVEALLPHLTP